MLIFNCYFFGPEDERLERGSSAEIEDHQNVTLQVEVVANCLEYQRFQPGHVDRWTFDSVATVTDSLAAEQTLKNNRTSC